LPRFYQTSDFNEYLKLKLNLVVPLRSLDCADEIHFHFLSSWLGKMRKRQPLGDPTPIKLLANRPAKGPSHGGHNCLRKRGPLRRAGIPAGMNPHVGYPPSCLLF